ncbi:MAG: ParB N-terminal domain-containing protein [Chitinispirillaceae bacterium]|nr:ParB N-terminal domain-containing protein [Chitinispirillaceae bacterium]
MNQVRIQEIPVAKLREHPENSNFMSAEKTQKLRQHIEQTGRYEPLTVRPHPSEEGKFQVINGHNRLRVLRVLKFEKANCVVWNLDDQQARLYLATLNRLSGKDVPERRAVLLDSLFKSFDIDELTLLLPDDKKQIEQLQRWSHLEFEEFPNRRINGEKLNVHVMLSFSLDEAEARELDLALDLIINKEKGNLSRSQALVHLVHFFLNSYEFPSGV